MARKIDMKVRDNNLRLLEKAAERIAEQSETVTMSALAEEMGFSRTHLYCSYLRDRAEELIEEYSCKPPVPKIDADEWEKKYYRLKEIYKKKCRECEKLKTKCEMAKKNRL